MDKEALRQRLMDTFLGEFAEHVGALNRDVLLLEKGPSDSERAQLIKTLFRTAHSLKGAARSVDLSPIEETCHSMESVLSRARDGELALQAAHFELLYETADALKEASDRLRGQRQLDGTRLSALTSRLEAAARGQTPTAKAEATTDSRKTRRATPPVPPVQATEPGQPKPRGTAPQTRRVPAGPSTGMAESEKPEAPPSDHRPARAQDRASVSSVPMEDGWVRIPARRLNDLLVRSEELLLVRHRLDATWQALRSVRDNAVNRIASWKGTDQLAKGWTAGADTAPENSRNTTLRDSQRLLPLLLHMIGDMREMESKLGRLTAELAQDNRAFDRAASEIHDEVRRVRMLPFQVVCQGLERTVRDLTKHQRIEAELVITGGDIELDRAILEGLKDPLLHLVRNAIDHGIEAPDEREAAGKPRSATITVAVSLRGSQIRIVVSDDGRGLDLDAIRRRALKRRLAVPSEEAEVARLIFLPGFSTSATITDLSGRGVGLDVVETKVQVLRGSVDVAWEPGSGSRFVVTVPLTLTTLKAILVRAAGVVLALDAATVHRIQRVNPADVRTVEGREMVYLDSQPVPAVALADTLGLPAHDMARQNRLLPVTILTTGEKRMAFVVDELLSEQEIVVRNLGARLRRVRHVAGVTLRPDGNLALILNTADLIRTASALPDTRGLARLSRDTEPEGRKRVLVVDNSVTARTVEQTLLVDAGYDVSVAADGVDAWEQLHSSGADLVVADVEMPRMDGFELTSHIRSSQRFGDLPVVLVTARARDADRARGVQVGADAYLVKSGFDQQSLLEAIEQLL